MGRRTFDPALGAPRWPWPGKRVYVLTSRPLPAEAPADVIVSRGGPAALLDELRAADLAGDVHVLGGPSTIQAFRALGAIDRLELVVLPILLGDGVPLFPRAAAPVSLRLEEHVSYPDGAVKLAYSPM